MSFQNLIEEYFSLGTMTSSTRSQWMSIKGVGSQVCGTQEAEVGQAQVWCKPGLYNETLSQNKEG
jgi:hypothetical protein